MNFAQNSVIIIDIIKERTSDGRIAQLCNSLNDSYFTENDAQANTPYTFGWGPLGGTEGTIKVTVGTVSFLVVYDSANDQIKVVGICGVSNLDPFSIANQILTYDQNGFRFTVQFALIDDIDINVTVEPDSNTSIQASA